MIPNLLQKVFGPSWRTSASSIATVAFGFVAFSPETFAGYPVLVTLAKYAAIGGFLSFGISAKDAVVGQKTILALRAELEAERAKQVK